MVGCGGCIVGRDAVPAVFLEPYIKDGYRPANRSLRFYLLNSLFFTHNESLNQWTALLTVFCHLCMFSYCSHLSILSVLNLTGLLIHLFSFLAHSFSHYNSVAHIGFYLLDFMGIYLGFSQVIPSFLVLHFNIDANSALVCGITAMLWNVSMFNSCCKQYLEAWQPWLDGGSVVMNKPRVLTFVKKGVWLYVVVWLLMLSKMCFISAPQSGSLYLHLSAIFALVFECALLHFRWPERSYPDYFQAMRSHPLTHICAATVTLGLVAAFIKDRTLWVTSSHESVSNNDFFFPGDSILVSFSLTNISICFFLAFRTINSLNKMSQV